MDSSEPKIGQRFQQETKYYRPSHVARIPEKAPGPVAAKIIPLPSPSLTGGPILWEALENRRSIRDYLPGPLSLKELSNLL